MYKRIVDAISIQLFRLYGLSGNIEETVQEFADPCFFIAPLNTIWNPEIDRTHQRKYLFDIRYYNPQTEPINELYEMGDDLMDNMELLFLGGNYKHNELDDFTHEEIKKRLYINEELVHGFDMSYKVVDDVLHFFVTYIVYLEEELITDKMNSMDREDFING